MDTNSDSSELDSLEAQETSVDLNNDIATAQNALPSRSIVQRLVYRISTATNIYLLVFLLMVVIALIATFVIYQSNTRSTDDETLSTQELTQETIDSLSGNNATVGDPRQLLNIESNAVFSGKVLIEDGLDVAGPIKVGGDLSLPGITVSGASAFDEIQVNSLSISGDTNVQGILTVQSGLTVNGQASFAEPISAPSLTIDSLQLNGDIQFNRHIDAGGSTPGVSSGSAVGSGGTVTISGTDTAGTVTVNIGSSASAGMLASVTFAASFSSNPHVVITPVASLGAGVVTGSQRFYLSNRTTSGFSIATSGSLSSGSISFDYIVID